MDEQAERIVPSVKRFKLSTYINSKHSISVEPCGPSIPCLKRIDPANYLPTEIFQRILQYVISPNHTCTYLHLVSRQWAYLLHPYDLYTYCNRNKHPIESLLSFVAWMLKNPELTKYVKHCRLTFFNNTGKHQAYRKNETIDLLEQIIDLNPAIAIEQVMTPLRDTLMFPTLRFRYLLIDDPLSPDIPPPELVHSILEEQRDIGEVLISAILNILPSVSSVHLRVPIDSSNRGRLSRIPLRPAQAIKEVAIHFDKTLPFLQQTNTPTRSYNYRHPRFVDDLIDIFLNLETPHLQNLELIDEHNMRPNNYLPKLTQLNLIDIYVPEGMWRMLEPVQYWLKLAPKLKSLAIHFSPSHERQVRRFPWLMNGPGEDLEDMLGCLPKDLSALHLYDPLRVIKLGFGRVSCLGTSRGLKTLSIEWRLLRGFAPTEANVGLDDIPRGVRNLRILWSIKDVVHYHEDIGALVSFICDRDSELEVFDIVLLSAPEEKYLDEKPTEKAVEEFRYILAGVCDWVGVKFQWNDTRVSRSGNIELPDIGGMRWNVIEHLVPAFQRSPKLSCYAQEW